MEKGNSGTKMLTKPHIGYMFGGAAQTTIVFLINVTLTYFYTNVIGLNIGRVTFVMLISRFLDGFSDIIAGTIIDRTKSKYGKARPWLLRMCIPHLIALIAMYTVPSTSENLQLIYIFVAYNFANTIVNTMAGLALSSLNSLMTRDPTERSQLNTMRQFGAPIMELAISALTIPAANSLGGDQKAWIMVIACFSIVATLCYFICFLWSRETAPEERCASDEPAPIGKSFLAVLKNKYWYMALGLWVSGTFNMTVTSMNLSYYCQYIFGNVNFMSVITTAEKVTTIATVGLLVPFFVKRLSKRNMTLCGAVVSIVGHALVLINPVDPTLAVTAAVARGIGMAFGAVVLFAMIADCVEYGHWKFGLRTEGIIFCAATVGQKFGQGISQAVAGALLNGAGFDGTLAVQSASSMSMITNIYLWVPIIFGFVNVALVLFYRLDRELPQIMQDLEARNATAKTQ
ncbi:MFS transporter [Agathobaculum sp. TL06]